MARVVIVNGIVDDGTASDGSQSTANEPIEVAYGENINIRLFLKTTSGKDILASTQHVITYGARTKPLPDGQLLFQHLGVVSPTNDGAWNCVIVPNDYRLIANGAGRFFFDIWLTDSVAAPPVSFQVALTTFIVTPAAISVTSPSTVPVPASITAYGLPLQGASGQLLVANGVSGSIQSVAWVASTAISGTTGPAGVTGPAGPTGATGPQGSPGPAPTPGTSGNFLALIGNAPQWLLLTQDMVGAAFALTLTGPTSPVDVGKGVTNPQFTNTHNYTPSVATLTGPDSVTQSIPGATATSIGYGGVANTFPAQNFNSTNVVNATRTWTYAATAGGIAKTTTAVVRDQARAYYGLAVPGTFNAAFITALFTTRLQSGFAQTYAIGAGDGTQKSYICLEDVVWGAPTTFKESVSQLPISFTQVASGVMVTNSEGVAVSHSVWQSPQFNTAAFSYVVS